MSQESTNRSFDELARALAEGSISRRRALGLFAGTAVAALLPSTRALADDDDHDGYTVCHVPGTPPNCDCSRARTIRGLSRRERNRHLRNHPCDSRVTAATTRIAALRRAPRRAQPRRRLCAYRMAKPAAPVGLRAVAATAPTAFVVNLIGSGSATAPARCLARVSQSALVAGPPHFVEDMSLDRGSARKLLCSVRLAQRILTVLPGSIVILEVIVLVCARGGISLRLWA